MKTNFILYVKDQKKSSDFYKDILGVDPILDVPGMTEFKLGEGFILGLMPETGIKSILGDSIDDPEESNGISRCELYFTVDNPRLYIDRAQLSGAIILSRLENRNWGDEAGYIKDIDGHVIAFARKIN
ncbi:MAG: hypothetical protein KDD50_14840 [Bdellovibrionales bacterium]|nr:hypothetical protein [Bdellovibrionales bacterium]